ncbi:MAG: hypothetical protein ACRCWS_08195 [Propionibacteriaceae bacterium]
MVLHGPLSRIANCFAVVAVLLAALAVAVQAPGWLYYVVIFAAIAIACVIIGHRCAVRLDDTGIKVPGLALIPWAEVEAVRVARAADLRLVCPTVDVARGRHLDSIPLEGLATRNYSERVITQARQIAARAKCPLEVADQAPQVKPRRGA